MTPDEVIKKIKRNKRKGKIERILCLIGFHKPYYKYGLYRSITYNTNPPSASSGPEHLGWHCRCCDLFLGFKCRNDGKSNYWFQLTIPR